MREIIPGRLWLGKAADLRRWEVILDAGVVSSSNATGGTGNLGGSYFYDLAGVNKKLSNLFLTGIVKAQYTSVSPAPAAGYSIHPVFEFGLTYGLK